MIEIKWRGGQGTAPLRCACGGRATVCRST